MGADPPETIQQAEIFSFFSLEAGELSIQTLLQHFNF
jgi:hypothetical protein